MDTGETQEIEELIRRAVVPYSERPGAEAVARLIDDLITHGQALHDRVAAVRTVRGTERVGVALVEWAYFVDAGPAGRGDHANWNHARTLARILRTLHSTHAEQPGRPQ
ncbi:hypothetical protein Slala03_68010 [Streptomyces lavendulae subsp. lavendulae]|uniref:DUF6415 family natural product biosynthesis protein n=1 Tax=Streptomyces lavendulae TaxID=1914 RepID=UPI0024A20663|nr:DUF6415 family natural product biosynthesis protein [Streptomyces lavendulae]GLV87112.1 hypothetical protein Slala03_68010 [Streptomyces lavendulae subsp. lavendulae]